MQFFRNTIASSHLTHHTRLISSSSAGPLSCGEKNIMSLNSSTTWSGFRGRATPAFLIADRWSYGSWSFFVLIFVELAPAMDTSAYLQFDAEPEEPKTMMDKFLAYFYAYTIGSCYYGGGYTPFCNREMGEFVEMHMNSNGVVHDHNQEPECHICSAEIQMKSKLHHHFKSHIGKWTNKNRRKFPWKVILHIILVLLITTQVCEPV